MRLLSIFIIACACLASAGTAQAGGSLKDGPMPGPTPGRCIGGAFAGPYAGVQLGFGETRSHEDTSNGFGFSDNDKGFTGGGFTGYNVQCGRVLFGVETDFNYFGTDTQSGISCPTCGGGSPLTASYHSSTDWYGTLRGRIGLVADERFLIYATGGLAYANVDHHFETNIGPGRVLNPPFSESSGGTQTGWTVGGGIEFLKYENWSIRAEALYVDLGSDDVTYKLTDGCGGTCTTRVNWDDNFWVVRFGLAYHFNQPEAVAYTPLK